MTTAAFWQEFETRIHKYDLLCHPFYEAWSAGQLTREDLREYSAAYYHHVAAFPTYLSALHSRLQDGELRRAVLRNLADEEIEGIAHSDLWLDFAEGMGADRDAIRSSEVPAEISALVKHFVSTAREADAVSALAAFYAYESQVPRVAEAKAAGLKEMYGADVKTCGYFSLHKFADVQHSKVWREQVEALIANDDAAAQRALDAGEEAAKQLWGALDRIEAKRQERIAVTQ